MRMKIAFSLIVAALMTAAPILATADDTDIYFNPRSSSTSEPLVMLSLDYRSDLGSTYGGCTNVGSSPSNLCAPAKYFYNAGLTSDIVALYGKPFTFFNALQLSLKLVLSKISGVKIGLMMNHNNTSNCVGPSATGCSNGGYMLLGFTELHDATPPAADSAASGFSKLLAKFAAIPVPQGNVAHSYQGAELFFEFFRYLVGGNIYNGHLGWSDFGTDSCKNVNDAVDGYNTNKCSNYKPTPGGTPIYSGAPVLGWDTGIENGTKYVSPLKDIAACTKIYTINFLFQVSNQDNDSNSAINTSKSSGGFGGTVVSNNSAFPDVLDFLYKTDLADGSFNSAVNITGSQSVTSYFIVDANHNNTTTQSYAQKGGTNTPYVLSEDPSILVNSLSDIFQQILSVSTTFTAASIPVNVFNRAQIQNDVYLGLFQADQGGKPAWDGNLKKLKFNNSLSTLVDATNTAAVAADGRIRFDALTYWTSASAITYGDGTTTTAGTDGRAVNRGAGGQKIPGFLGTGGVGASNSVSGARQLFYDNSTTSGRTGSLVALNADTATATALSSYLPALSFASTLNCSDYTTNNSSTSPTSITTLTQLRFLRGMDALDNSQANAETNSTVGGNGLCSESRGWLMGDPLHSRPLPINYGTAGGYSTSNPAIYVAIGTNDGYMHFLQNTSTGGTETGTEVWAYMPKEVMGGAGGLQQKLILNTPTSPLTHPYGVDGAPVAYTLDNNGDGTITPGGTAPSGGDKAYLYFGLRRGGSGFYGLDVSSPLSPAFLWKITNDQTDYTELGLSFSRPQIGKVRVDGTDHTVLVVGGGYSTNKDWRTHSSDSTYVNSADTNSTTSNKGCGCGIFIIDATTGDLLWKAVNGTSTGSSSATKFTHSQLVDSIPADVSIADTDGDGYIDRVLVADTGGNVWRADLGAFVTTGGITNPVIDDRTKWKLTKVATLGYHYSATKANDLRFFNQIDLVRSTDSTGPFDAVILGSGDRENPLDYTGTATNYFFMIKDRAVGVGAASDSSLVPTDLGDVSNDCLQLNTCGGSAPNLAKGWRMQLAVGTGEKNLARSITIGGSVYFTSYVPPQGGEDSNSCGPKEGSGVQYAVALQNAFSVVNYYSGDDASGSAGVASTARDRYDLLASGGIPAQDVFIPGGMLLRPDLKTEKPKFSSRINTYWQRGEK